MSSGVEMPFVATNAFAPNDAKLQIHLMRSFKWTSFNDGRRQDRHCPEAMRRAYTGPLPAHRLFDAQFVSTLKSPSSINPQYNKQCCKALEELEMQAYACQGLVYRMKVPMRADRCKNLPESSLDAPSVLHSILESEMFPDSADLLCFGSCASLADCCQP